MISLLHAVTFLVFVAFLCVTYLIRCRMQLRHWREEENTKFLTADLNARIDSEKQAVERDRLALEKERLAIERSKAEILVATFVNGHATKCAYCDCGYSKTRTEAEKTLMTGASK